MHTVELPEAGLHCYLWCIYQYVLQRHNVRGVRCTHEANSHTRSDGHPEARPCKCGGNHTNNTLTRIQKPTIDAFWHELKALRAPCRCPEDREPVVTELTLDSMFLLRLNSALPCKYPWLQGHHPNWFRICLEAHRTH
jgi:hypothetical protein